MKSLHATTRNRLKGAWGIVDVDDCCNGALFLAKEGKVDADRMIITGGSAGKWGHFSSFHRQL